MNNYTLFAIILNDKILLKKTNILWTIPSIFNMDLQSTTLEAEIFKSAGIRLSEDDTIEKLFSIEMPQVSMDIFVIKKNMPALFNLSGIEFDLEFFSKEDFFRYTQYREVSKEFEKIFL